jgi:hypothetical protein
MTTFTTEDRIIAEKDGSFTINVEGSPPHIVSGGASVIIKELTNQEIWELWKIFDPSEDVWISDEQVQGFARAILRKAQER